MTLPILQQPCNRCGECCTKGGGCIARQWHPTHHNGTHLRTLEFKGRCELLRTHADGTTSCMVFEQMDPAILRRQGIVGTCEWPSLRRPVPSESWILLVWSGGVTDAFGGPIVDRDTLPMRQYYDPRIHVGPPPQRASIATGRMDCYASLVRNA